MNPFSPGSPHSPLPFHQVKKKSDICIKLRMIIRFWVSITSRRGDLQSTEHKHQIIKLGPSSQTYFGTKDGLVRGFENEILQVYSEGIESKSSGIHFIPHSQNAQ